MSPRAPAKLRARGLVCAALLAASVSSASAQTVRVTTGEHAGFTRLVLQSRENFAWMLSPTGRTRLLRVTAEAIQYDATELFRVIPRTRLADLRQVEGGLELRLDCDCEIRTDEPRPGVAVFDILDPEVRPTPAPRALAHSTDPQWNVARAAGGDLARRMRTDAGAGPDAIEALGFEGTPDSTIALTEQLAGQMSLAVAQGLLSAEQAQRTSLMQPAKAQLEGVDLSNLRISLATEPPEGPGGPASKREACKDADGLAFQIDESAPPFSLRHAQFMRSLYGEFDLPDAAGHEALARLYLENGFGAEARLVLENAPAQVSGRDLLLGLSDVLEDRYSNARLRLSERVDCGGSLALFATVAGAEAAAVNRHAPQIARVYGELPIPLRRALGEQLVRRLIDAHAQDAARMVADVLRRVDFPPAPEMPLIDALLDAARGQIDSAAARLDQEGRKDGAALVVRLRLALERGETPPEALLADAEAVAAGERRSETGLELMALLVRLHKTSGRAADAFALLDRLAQWMPVTSENVAQLADLRNRTWRALIDRADDRDFLETFFDRSDWQSDDLEPRNRMALAGRLLDFGLTDPATVLLRDDRGRTARRLRARLLLLTNDPAAALEALSGLNDSASGVLRAQAQRALGIEESDEDLPGISALLDDTGAPDSAGETRLLNETGNPMQRSTLLLSESSDLRDALNAILDPER